MGFRESGIFLYPVPCFYNMHKEDYMRSWLGVLNLRSSEYARLRNPLTSLKHDLLTGPKEVVMPTGLNLHMSAHTRVHVRHKTTCVATVGLACRRAGVWEANLPQKSDDTFSPPQQLSSSDGAAPHTHSIQDFRKQRHLVGADCHWGKKWNNTDLKVKSCVRVCQPSQRCVLYRLAMYR